MARQGFLLLAYIASFSYFINYGSANQWKELKIHTIPVYAMLANANLLNSTQCGKELKDLREAIDQKIFWSLKVLDASGEPSPGFVYGNNYWLGNRAQCEDVSNQTPISISEDKLQNNSRYRPVEDEFPPYEVKYFVANFRHNSTLQYHVGLPTDNLIQLGMCLPASCSKDQLVILLETVITNRNLLINELYSVDFTLIEVRDLIDDHQWLLSETFITMTIIVILTLLLMIIGTAYDVLIYQRRLKKYYKRYQNCTNINPLTFERKETLHEDTDDHLEKLKSQSNVSKIFQAFSVYSNTKIIFNLNIGKDSLPILHGLKFLTMCWIIIAHTAYYTRDYIDNKTIAWRLLDDFSAQFIANAFLSVDTFFVIGGFLLAYLYFKNEIVKPYNYFNIIKLYFFYILKRYLRLTPTYMIVLGLIEINSTWYSKTSEFYVTERPNENCQKYWWRNMLYIQNFFPHKEMCMSWSWFLANDMLFFVIVSFLLLLSSIYFKLAASLVGLLLISSIILGGYTAYINDFMLTFDQQYKLLDEIYVCPWIRIGPYLVGVITGYILVKLKNKLKLDKKTLILFWILGSSLNLIMVFGLHQKRIPILTAAFYIALGKTVWAIGIAWLLIACCTNNGGIINRILSLKIWIPLSRLTYIVYLINPMIITSTHLFTGIPVHFHFIEIGLLCLGYTVICYMSSYILSLMFEIPYTLLIKEGINHLSIKR